MEKLTAVVADLFETMIRFEVRQINKSYKFSVPSSLLKKRGIKKGLRKLALLPKLHLLYKVVR